MTAVAGAAGVRGAVCRPEGQGRRWELGVPKSMQSQVHLCRVRAEGNLDCCFIPETRRAIVLKQFSPFLSSCDLVSNRTALL